MILKLANFDACTSLNARSLPMPPGYMWSNLNASLSFRYLLVDQNVVQLPFQVYHNWGYRLRNCFINFSSLVISQQNNQSVTWSPLSSVPPIRSGKVLLASTVHRQALPASKWSYLTCFWWFEDVVAKSLLMLSGAWPDYWGWVWCEDDQHRGQTDQVADLGHGNCLNQGFDCKLCPCTQ